MFVNRRRCTQANLAKYANPDSYKLSVTTELTATADGTTYFTARLVPSLPPCSTECGGENIARDKQRRKPEGK
ncbi:hypothetical protein NPIL_324531 [Nephila pilipes]|uniref:Uncharacterized protein n=1 Tax=Nephila pilipes TaxID=299642 RepID=A0A8X6N791_NEPPI|nr:hypothetical protein NPIL_324531 [Nephila pilipes]